MSVVIGESPIVCTACSTTNGRCVPVLPCYHPLPELPSCPARVAPAYAPVLSILLQAKLATLLGPPRPDSCWNQLAEAFDERPDGAEGEDS